MTAQDIKAKMSDLYTELKKAGDDSAKISDVRAKMYALTSNNKSEAMRTLLSLDLTVSTVAKILNVRYQFVNNVRAEMLRKKD